VHNVAYCDWWHDSKHLVVSCSSHSLATQHSIIHGRPFALKGNFYASMFFHFEPMGYTEQLERKMISATQRKSAKRLFEQAFARQSVADFVEPKTRSLPRYIHEDSEEAKMWRQEYAFDRDESTKSSAPKYKAKVKGVTNAHVVAANGSMEQFRQIAEKNPEALFLADGNGWKPLHEASRGGQVS
jgi:prolyl 4-hydroxylase